MPLARRCFATRRTRALSRASTAQYDPNGTVPIQDLNTLQTYFIQRGVLEYKTPLDLAPFVNTDLAKEVAAELDKK